MRCRGPQSGFTLLELIIAMAVFATLSVLAYGGLRSVLQTRQAIDESTRRLEVLQFCMALLEQDLTQLLDGGLPVDGATLLPPLRWDGNRLELIRSGHANPQGLARGSLLRVGYEVRASGLYRNTGLPAPSAADPEGDPIGSRLLEGVTTLSLRFLDANRNWVNGWGQEGLSAALLSQTPAPSLLPRAVELTLSLRDGGDFKLLVPMPQGPSTAGTLPQ